jgi:site-specific DNA-methyltransferase (adenine-specific)
MDKIADKSVDAIIADLPYGTTNSHWDFEIPIEELFEIAFKKVKENGVVIFFAVEPFATKLRVQPNYKYDLYWLKNKPTGVLNAKKQPLRRIENICIFYKKQPTYNPIMTERTESEIKQLSKKSVYTSSYEGYNEHWAKTANRDDNKYKYPTNVLEFKTVFNRSKEKLPHPTQKPVELMEYLIKTYTNEGETVLDNCMGSGTTGVACKKTGRHFIGIEKDEKYFELAVRRVSEYCG